MVVVLVEPAGEGVTALMLTVVAPRVRLTVGHGAVEALDLAVGLWPVRTGPLRGDRQGLAGVAPQVRPVGTAVVRKDPLDGDAPLVEPLDGLDQDSGGGEGGFVVVDLSVGDAGVVIDDGVDVGIARQRVPVPILRLARGGGAVLLAPLTADVAPTATIGDVAELLHAYVQHRSGVVVFVSTDRFAGGAVDMGQPVQVCSDQNAVDRRRGDAQSTGQLHRPLPQAQP